MPRPNPDYDPSKPEAQPRKQRKQAAAPEQSLPAWASHKKMQSETIPGPQQASNRGGWISQSKHWRQSERERFQYDGRDYERPETLWTQRSVRPAADDGRRTLLLRSGDRQVYRRSLPGRSPAAIRRHRLGAGLARLSEHRHRQSQPARLVARPARRHRGRAARWSTTSIVAASACCFRSCPGIPARRRKANRWPKPPRR